MYRTSANPNVDEVVYSLDVVSSAGKHLLGVLLALSMICLVCLGVTLFAGAPREVAGLEWLMALGAACFALPALFVHRGRARTLRIVRNGDTVRLSTEGAEVMFPITCRGAQVTMQVEGIPIYEAYLQLSDATKKGIVVGETRGAIHGKIAGWFEGGVDPEVRAGASLEVRATGHHERLRDAVEEWNKAVANEQRFRRP